MNERENLELCAVSRSQVVTCQLDIGSALT
jgi:hypothetical protein